MTADGRAPEPNVDASVPTAAAAATPVVGALLVIALAAAGGWLYTVRELNRTLAYEVAGAAALRQAGALRGALAPLPEAAELQRVSQHSGRFERD